MIDTDHSPDYHSSFSFNKLVLTIIFGLLFSLAFLQNQLFLIAWFALIPLLHVCKHATYRHVYIYSLLGGFVAMITGKYWIYDFILISKGFPDTKSIALAIGYWLYSAHIFVLAMLLYTFLSRSLRLFQPLLFALCFTLINEYFPVLFKLGLADSQSKFTYALQAIEFTGAIGLSFLIAFTNGLVCYIYTEYFRNSSSRPQKLTRQHTISRHFRDKGYYLLCIPVLWCLFGVFRYHFWLAQEAKMQSFEVGLVQTNQSAGIGTSKRYDGYSLAYPPEFEMIERLSNLSPDIIVLPEGQYRQYHDSMFIQNAYQMQVTRLQQTIMFQDFQNLYDPSLNKNLQYNTAALLDANGQQQAVYQKIKRIAFGEYLPAFAQAGFLGDLFVNHLGDFLNEIEAGETYQSFSHPKATIVPLICYETTFSAFVAKAVQSADSAKQAMMMVAMSNDAWFGSSHQPFQHVLASSLRAIENRVPLVHVANNGPSIVIAASGRKILQTPFQQAGGFVANVPISIDSSASFYSKYPWLLKYLFTFILSILCLLSVYLRLKRQ